MSGESRALTDLVAVLRDEQTKGSVASFSVRGVAGSPVIRLRTIGKDKAWALQLTSLPPKQVQYSNQEGPYYFLGSELRPGSGIIRIVNGTPRGPGGTLTCLLASRDGRDNYFAAAGHVLKNFWVPDGPGADVVIHRNVRGFPGTNSRRSVGKVFRASDKPPSGLEDDPAEIDVGIVKLAGEFDLKQRTTCYGSLGEWREGEEFKVRENQVVMKCGAEEPHFTEAVVDLPDEDNVVIYGPQGTPFRFRNQVILRSDKSPKSEEAVAKNGPRSDAFAVSGDSGTLVVDRDSRKPLGMLIGGSILDGTYVMTPFSALEKYWLREDLVFVRG